MQHGMAQSFIVIAYPAEASILGYSGSRAPPPIWNFVVVF